MVFIYSIGEKETVDFSLINKEKSTFYWFIPLFREVSNRRAYSTYSRNVLSIHFY